ncbi:MAG: DNA polymerase III subunit gamma/tau, partial [Planctomycetota bacterium]
MAYQAMARRYRPSGFDEVIGQEHVAQTLKNAITSDRVAHAYLFCGPHGVGKTSMARIFAKALNCTGGPAIDIPADCPICTDINDGIDPDVQEIDGASNNSVDQIRTLREQAGYVPARAKHKIYIIDEVHMLSSSAFNALLKTLEEPPAHVKFILATTEPHKLLETVLSRCQRFDFRLVPPVKIKGYLADLCGREGVSTDDDALEAIAAFSNGSMRDSLVLLDQLSSYCPEKITRTDVEKVRGAAGIENVIS